MKGKTYSMTNPPSREEVMEDLRQLMQDEGEAKLQWECDNPDARVFVERLWYEDYSSEGPHVYRLTDLSNSKERSLEDAVGWFFNWLEIAKES
jgi:hypothetical protein